MRFPTNGLAGLWVVVTALAAAALSAAEDPADRHAPATAAKPDANLLLSTGADKTIRLGDARSGTQLWKRECASPVSAAAFPPATGRCATASQQHGIELWHFVPRCRISGGDAQAASLHKRDEHELQPDAWAFNRLRAGLSAEQAAAALQATHLRPSWHNGRGFVNDYVAKQHPGHVFSLKFRYTPEGVELISWSVRRKTRSESFPAIR